MADPTREELKQLLYECMYTEKERKRIPNDGSVFLSDVEAAMSLTGELITKAQEQLLDEVLEMKPPTTVNGAVNAWTYRIEAKRKAIKEGK